MLTDPGCLGTPAKIIYLERDANAMMRNWKQSEERRPSCRTVIVSLVGLLLSGSGITWLIRAYRSRIKPALPFTYEGHLGYLDPVVAVAQSPDGQRIASGHRSSTVQVWDTTDGGHVFTYYGHSSDVDATAWSPDGQRIASGSTDKTVQVWDATNGGQVYTYEGHSSWVCTVAWSPNGQRIASGSADNTVQVWNATDGGQVYTYRRHF